MDKLLRIYVEEYNVAWLSGELSVDFTSTEKLFRSLTLPELEEKAFVELHVGSCSIKNIYITKVYKFERNDKGEISLRLKFAVSDGIDNTHTLVRILTYGDEVAFILNPIDTRQETIEALSNIYRVKKSGGLVTYYMHAMKMVNTQYSSYAIVYSSINSNVHQDNYKALQAEVDRLIKIKENYL